MKLSHLIIMLAIGPLSGGCIFAIDTGLGSIHYDTGDTRLKASRTNVVKGKDRKTTISIDTKADDAEEIEVVFPVED